MPAVGRRAHTRNLGLPPPPPPPRGGGVPGVVGQVARETPASESSESHETSRGVSIDRAHACPRGEALFSENTASRTQPEDMHTRICTRDRAHIWQLSLFTLSTPANPARDLQGFLDRQDARLRGPLPQRERACSPPTAWHHACSKGDACARECTPEGDNPPRRHRLPSEQGSRWQGGGTRGAVFSQNVAGGGRCGGRTFPGDSLQGFFPHKT